MIITEIEDKLVCRGIRSTSPASLPGAFQSGQQMKIFHSHAQRTLDWRCNLNRHTTLFTGHPYCHHIRTTHNRRCWWIPPSLAEPYGSMACAFLFEGTPCKQLTRDMHRSSCKYRKFQVSTRGTRLLCKSLIHLIDIHSNPAKSNPR